MTPGLSNRPLRLALLAQGYVPPFDEGVKVLLKNLKDAFARVPGVDAVPLMGKRLGRSLLPLARGGFDYVVYVPVQSATFNSLLKARLLSAWGRSKVVLVAPQIRSYGFKRRWLARLLQPHRIFVQSRRAAESLTGLGFRRVAINGWGVDLRKFHPVGADEKARLRRKYGIPGDRTVYLHFGHLRPGRNVAEMEVLARRPDAYPLLVCSTTTPRTHGLQDRLEAAGVRLMTDFIPENQEIYQLSDYYVFPTTYDQSAIEFPLSVLEALACGIPVFHKNFGALLDLGRVGYGNLQSYDSPEELLKPSFSPDRPFPIARFGWDRVVRDLLDQIVRNDA